MKSRFQIHLDQWLSYGVEYSFLHLAEQYFDKFVYCYQV